MEISRQSTGTERQESCARYLDVVPKRFPMMHNGTDATDRRHRAYFGEMRVAGHRTRSGIPCQFWFNMHKNHARA